MEPYEYNTKKGKRYRVAYRTPDNKQHNKGGFTTKREARAWYRQKMVEIENHGFSSNEKVTFEEIANRWLDNKKQTVAGSTYKKYETECNKHLIPALGDKLLKDISISTCQSLVYQWAKDFKFYNKMVNDATSIFDLGIKYKLIHDNPFKLIEHPKKDKDDERKIRSFTKDEFITFKKGLHEHYESTNYKAFAFLFILAHTGLRKGELLALTWNDIDLEGGFLHIKRAVTRDAKNNLIIGKTKNIYSVRDVPIGPETIKVLKKWRSEQYQELKFFNINTLKPNQLVFTSQKGGILTPSKPGKWLNIIEKKYNLPSYVTPHGLRHTYTSLLIEDGMSVNDVASVLGHKDATITIKVYNDLHPIKDNSIGKIIENL
ncbi:tyrosine-type recombinase/integrase [Limosilactobacillus reuteri]|uniref:tyrosine-type recombinase/integrase n=1 Tax=Limosilactobacillus reuteri TaxID=1598 RepID=UPI00129BABA7|nr:site-specific integrase [Limosilactobacillus reuteri]MRI06890.1 tyrosine-type recombinase/integrase [Limosilactobacillus reuteri]